MLLEPVLLFGRHWELTWEMTKREIKDRYRGTALGLFWAIGHPLALMLIYIFVFTVVFRARMGGTVEMPLDYTAYMLSGLVPWLAFQEAMNKGTSVILENVNLVKQVVFPIEILPLKVCLASLAVQGIATVILMCYIVLTHLTLPWTFVLLPLLFLFQTMAMAGFCFVLAPVGAYIRDLRDVVQVFSFAGIFLLPVVYLPQWVPTVFKPIVYGNPLSYMIWCYQDVCYFGRIEHPLAWVIFPIGSIAAFQLGYRAFVRCKQSIGNFV
jgi:lipopolysaccharide transport system permease protein